MGIFLKVSGMIFPNNCGEIIDENFKSSYDRQVARKRKGAQDARDY